ncbi:SPOR domain-containing protein, partial [Xanthomonas sp. Kuri4-1]
AAEALIKRIVAAGFGDYYLVSQGDRDNTVALGQYRSREGAERRQAALVAAGFPAQLVPNPGSTPSRWWIDLATSAPSAAGRGDFRGVPQRSLDCAALR